MPANQTYNLRLLLDYLKSSYDESDLEELVFGTELEGVTNEWTDLTLRDMIRQLLDYARRVNRLDVLLQLLGEDRDRGELFRQEYEPGIRLAGAPKPTSLATISSPVPERRFSGAEGTSAELPVRKTLTAPADPSNKLMAHVQLLRETHERIKQEVARLEQCVDYRHKAEEINGCIEGLNEKTFELRDLLEQRRPILPAVGDNLDAFQRAVDELRAAIDDHTRFRSYRDLITQVGVILRLGETAVPQAATIKARHDEIVGVRNSLMNISSKLGELKVDLRQNAYEVKRQCDDSLPQINLLSQTLDGLMHDILDFMMSLDGAIQASIRDLHELTTTEVYQVGNLEQAASVSAPAPPDKKFGAGQDISRRSRTYTSRRPRPGPSGGASSISNLPTHRK